MQWEAKQVLTTCNQLGVTTVRQRTSSSLIAASLARLSHENSTDPPCSVVVPIEASSCKVSSCEQFWLQWSSDRGHMLTEWGEQSTAKTHEQSFKTKIDFRANSFSFCVACTNAQFSASDEIWVAGGMTHTNTHKQTTVYLRWLRPPRHKYRKKMRITSEAAKVYSIYRHHYAHTVVSNTVLLTQPVRSRETRSRWNSASERQQQI